MNLGIVTLADDFHALAIRQELRRRGCDCAIIEADNLIDAEGIRWAVPSRGPVSAYLPQLDGDPVAVHSLDLLWWRRLRGPRGPRIPERLRDESASDVATNDCFASLLGIVLTCFRGRWLSHPEATRRAENKLVQLEAARAAGLRLPRTLISNLPGDVRRFCEDLDYRVIAKAVSSSAKTPLLTGRITPEILAHDGAIRLSPAIYQEYVPGTQHLRVCCFGETLYTALLRSDRIDWRYPLDCEAEPYALDPIIESKLRDVLARLALRMGIFDLKLGPNGEPVWLEVNPQGQFLFLEGLCGLPLTERFTEFLLQEAALPRVRTADVEHLTNDIDDRSASAGKGPSRPEDES